MYPEKIKIEKNVVSHAWQAGLGIGVGIYNYLFKVEDDTAEEVSLAPRSTEEMVKQCLRFYLEPCKDILLSEEGYPHNFRLDEFVGSVKRIFEQHYKPVVQHGDRTVPVSTDNLKDVRKTLCKYFGVIYMHILSFLGVQRMA